MKVIFLQNVPNVARAGDIKDVADGYGRNYLLPQKLAAQADPRAMQHIEAQIKAQAKLVDQATAEMQELADLLNGAGITIKARVGSNERLYGSITAADIAAELENATGVAIDRRKVDLESPIRQVGTHEVLIKLSGDIVANITLTVAEEESS